MTTLSEEGQTEMRLLEESLREDTTLSQYSPYTESLNFDVDVLERDLSSHIRQAEVGTEYAAGGGQDPHNVGLAAGGRSSTSLSASPVDPSPPISAHKFISDLESFPGHDSTETEPGSSLSSMLCCSSQCYPSEDADSEASQEYRNEEEIFSVSLRALSSPSSSANFDSQNSIGESLVCFYQSCRH